MVMVMYDIELTSRIVAINCIILVAAVEVQWEGMMVKTVTCHAKQSYLCPCTLVHKHNFVHNINKRVNFLINNIVCRNNVMDRLG